MAALGNDFDALLTRGALGVLAAAAGWSVLVVAAIVVEARTNGRLQLAGRLGCPEAVRAWALAGFLALVATASPAHATDPGPGSGAASGAGSGAASGAAPGAASGAAPRVAVDGLPLPDRVTGHSDPGTWLVVRRGDSLWQIARRRLAADATDRQVALLVETLFAANRHVIGADPDCLLPGQRLRLDTPTTSPDPLSDTTPEEP